MERTRFMGYQGNGVLCDRCQGEGFLDVAVRDGDRVCRGRE